MRCVCTRSDSKVMRLIFFWLYWQYCSPLTQTAIDLDPSSIPNCSGVWLCSDSLWSRCLTCQDVFANLVTKMEARNIAQRYAIFFVLHSVTVPPQHVVNFSRQAGDDAMSRAQAFRWHKMFFEGRTIVEDEQRNGRASTTRTSNNTA